MNDIAVSVFCTAFNHEKYIEQCMDSILSQKTNFKFELLINDDASTDKTAEIIRKYQKRYPEIVFPIFQEINQYSQNVCIPRTFLLPKARGKYIAICEGDDYWTDDSKLQVQFDLMEKYSEIDMCTNAAVKIKDGKKIGVISPSTVQKIFTPKEVISGGGNMFATNSIFYRKSMRENTPRFILCKEFDYSTQVWGSLRGGILYIPKKMSAYRVMSDGSWSVRMKANPKAYIGHLKKVEQMESILAEEIDEKYKDVVLEDLVSVRFSILEAEGDYKKLKQPEYVKCFKNFSLRRKVKFYYKRLLKMWR